jgi:hypothetical protein
LLFNFLIDASPPLRSNFPLLLELLCLFAGDSDQHCSLLLLGFSFPVMKTLIQTSITLGPANKESKPDEPYKP